MSFEATAAAPIGFEAGAALDGFAALEGLASLAGLAALEGFAALKGLAALEGFALKGFAALEGFAALKGLAALEGFTALEAFAAEITVLLLQLCVLERHVAAMTGIKMPVLGLARASEGYFVELAETRRVYLDRCKAAVTPIPVTPQGRPYKQKRPKSKYRADRPPWRIPEEWHVVGLPEIETEDERGIINGDINVIRVHRFDDDVFRRPHIVGIRCRRDPPDLLLLARLQIASSLRLRTQCLNCSLNVVGLSQKGLT